MMNITFSEAEENLTVEQLRDVEERIGVTLPEPYKQFLLYTNGGRPEPACFTIKWKSDQPANHWNTGTVDFFLSIYDGPSTNFLRYERRYKGRIPGDTLAIADDPGGNLVLIGVGPVNMGKVFFWMHSYEKDNADYSNVGFVANDFNQFLESLFDCE